MPQARIVCGWKASIEVDALVIRGAAEIVGAVEDDVARLGPEARALEQQPERHAGPFPDRAPPLDAIVAGDLGPRGQPPDPVQGQRQRPVHQAIDNESPIGEARGDMRLIGGRARHGVAVGAEEGRHVRRRKFPRQRRPVDHQPLHAYGEILGGRLNGLKRRRAADPVAARQQQPARARAKRGDHPATRDHDFSSGRR